MYFNIPWIFTEGIILATCIYHCICCQYLYSSLYSNTANNRNRTTINALHTLHSNASCLVHKTLRFYIRFSDKIMQIAQFSTTYYIQFKPFHNNLTSEIGISNSERSGNSPHWYLAKNRILPAEQSDRERGENGRNVFWSSFGMYFGLYSLLQGCCIVA